MPLGNSKREGSKSLLSRRILAQNTVFQGYFARKMEIPGEKAFYEAGRESDSQVKIPGVLNPPSAV